MKYTNEEWASVILWHHWQGPTSKFYLVPPEPITLFSYHFHSLNSKAYWQIEADLQDELSAEHKISKEQSRKVTMKGFQGLKGFNSFQINVHLSFLLVWEQQKSQFESSESQLFNGVFPETYLLVILNSLLFLSPLSLFHGTKHVLFFKTVPLMTSFGGKLIIIEMCILLLSISSVCSSVVHLEKYKNTTSHQRKKDTWHIYHHCMS